MSKVSTQVLCATILGADAHIVPVEIECAQGLPGIGFIGKNASKFISFGNKLRVALRAQGFEIPREKIIVNLGEAEIAGFSTSLELGIALGILQQTKQIAVSNLDEYVFVGEFGLSGNLLTVVGSYAYEKLVQNISLKLVTSPVTHRDSKSDSFIDSLSQLRKGIGFNQSVYQLQALDLPASSYLQDFAFIYGQEAVKRALCVSAIGRHNVMLLGPAGVGKTLLARAYPAILENLNENKKDEVTLVKELSSKEIYPYNTVHPPFVEVSQTATKRTLLGGGTKLAIGELTRAHNGVLFLDEIGEFNPAVLNTLRKPIEDKCITHMIPNKGVFKFPCNVQVIAASNPCPCSNLGNPQRFCSCTQAQIESYKKRISQPLLDRFDISVYVGVPSQDVLVNQEQGLTTQDMRSQVQKGLEFRAKRLAHCQNSFGDQFDKLGFGRSARQTLIHTTSSLGISARGVVSIARIARSIADLECSHTIEEAHVYEAVGYRHEEGNHV